MDNKEQLQSLNLNGNQVNIYRDEMIFSWFDANKCLLQFGEEAREAIKEMLGESQRLQALEEMDEDDSDGEESDNEVGVSSLLIKLVF